MSHHRLFVALPPPAAVRGRLMAGMGGIAGARWQDDAQLHCTIRFLGDVEGHQAEELAHALLALRHPPIDAALEGYGCFGRGDRIDSLWIGLAPAEPLRALHAKVDRLLARVGIAPDPRAYRPHITVARFSRSTAPAAAVVAGMAPPPALPVRFDEMRLYESLLGQGGARYDTIARYLLA